LETGPQAITPLALLASRQTASPLPGKSEVSQQHSPNPSYLLGGKITVLFAMNAVFLPFSNLLEMYANRVETYDHLRHCILDRFPIGVFAATKTKLLMHLYLPILPASATTLIETSPQMRTG
jgi:hypothetical protein